MGLTSKLKHYRCIIDAADIRTQIWRKNPASYAYTITVTLKSSESSLYKPITLHCRLQMVHIKLSILLYLSYKHTSLFSYHATAEQISQQDLIIESSVKFKEQLNFN